MQRHRALFLVGGPLSVLFLLVLIELCGCGHGLEVYDNVSGLYRFIKVDSSLGEGGSVEGLIRVWMYGLRAAWELCGQAEEVWLVGPFHSVRRLRRMENAGQSVLNSSEVHTLTVPQKHCCSVIGG